MLMTLICDLWPFLFCCGFRKDEVKSFWALPLKQTTNTVPQFDTFRFWCFPYFSRKISEMFEKDMGVSENRGKTPKWMVKIMEKPYFLMDDLGGFNPLFSETPIWKKWCPTNWLVQPFSGRSHLGVDARMEVGGTDGRMDGDGWGYPKRDPESTWFQVLKPCKWW